MHRSTTTTTMDTMDPIPTTFTGWLQAAREKIDSRAKPPGSLGTLEEWAVKIAILQRDLHPHLTAARLLIFAGDHGLTQSHPGVSAYPREVSIPIFSDIAAGTGASAILSRGNSCALDIIDVGLDTDFEEAKNAEKGSVKIVPGGAPHIQVTHAKVRRNSHDMTVGPALSPEEMKAAMDVGRQAVQRHLLKIGNAEYIEFLQSGGPLTIRQKELIHYSARHAFLVGELGIGNTTSAAALVAALTQTPPSEVAGKGTGLTEEGVSFKAQAIEKAFAVNAALIASKDPYQILQAVGGLEMAAMVGAFLEGGFNQVPMLVDGFVSGAAALVALHISKIIGKSLFWTHKSDEKGATILLEAAKVKTEEGAKERGGVPQAFIPPPLQMNLRLGEGTGALLAVPLLRSACGIMREMASMEEALNGHGNGEGNGV